jgi:NAD(P)-dependent dehydrogenase (short-subunit alcohol dehydrogenase family)
MHDEVLKMFDMTGKVSLVVGGARDLGLDMASILAAAGSDVAISSRTIERAEKAAGKLRAEYGVDALPLALDHTKSDQVVETVKKVHQWKGRIDVLVNNAGGGSGTGQLFGRSAVDMDNLLAANLNGPLYCCKEVGKIMADQGHGKIINIASIAGIVGRDRRMYNRSEMNGQPIDYAAAKAGVIGMTRDLAGYLTPKGICVNCISPGGFERGQPEQFIKDYSDEVPMGRMGRDETDLKGAVLFLASSASDYVTGQNIVVDGGWVIWK